MSQPRLESALIGGLLSLVMAFAATAQDLRDGADARTLAMGCTGCHGEDGNSAGPAVPTIAGMHEGYFIDVMEGFRNGDVYGTIMGPIARGCSDAEIERLAAYFHAQPFAPAKQPFDPALSQAGRALHDEYCERCHSDGGTRLEGEEYHILAGQWRAYLRNTLEDFRAGRRVLDRKMERKLERLIEYEGEASLEALIAYYASQQ